MIERSAPRRRRSGRNAARAWLAATLALLGIAPSATSAGAPPHERPAEPAGVAASSAASPSVHYRHAQAHAADVIAFEPGEPVSVPRASRADATAFLDQPAGHAVAGELASTAGTTQDTDVEAAAVVGSSGLRREVFGFLPFWQLHDRSTVLDWQTLSTVAYFSVGCTSSGGLWKRNADGSVSTGWAGWTSSRMTTIINEAHEHGARVVLTVSCFAWSGAGAATQASLLGSSAARSTLARQVAAAVRDRGADGANLDFEPIVPGYADEFTALVRAVRRELDGAGSGYQLTFDAMGSVGNQPIAEATAPGGADAIVIMGYDYRTRGSNVAGSISPLSGPAYDLTDTIDAFTAKVPGSKLILAVPYYGRAWSTASNALHAPTLKGAKFGAVADPLYTHAADLAAAYGRRYDRVEKSPWATYRRETCNRAQGCVTHWRQMYYDDAASLKLRYDLVNRAGLRGVGIWALGYDGTRPELRAALAEKFLADRTPPLAGITTLPARVLAEDFRVRWRATDASEIRDYDVEMSVDGGPFAPWLTDTELTSGIVLGTHGRTYAFRVRATDAQGNTSAWESIPLGYGSVPGSLVVGGTGRVVVDGLNLRSSPSTDVAVKRRLAAGEALKITGGPVRHQGYTWYRVSGPVRQSNPIDSSQVGGWVAAHGNGVTHVVPRGPVYATRVEAGITGLRLADGGPRVLTPDGDGRQDTLQLAWTNRRTFDTVTLLVLRPNGSLLGSVMLPARKADAGASRWIWNGRVNGALVPSGSYLLQLQGRRGTMLFNPPSGSPPPPAQIARLGVVVGLAALNPSEIVQ